MKILQPISIRSMTLKNRMVVSAMVTNYCNEDGMPTEKFIAYHETKARGGWGLIITEDYAISPTAGGFKRLPGLWQDEQIPAHKAFTDRIHAAGGTIAAQIYHAGRETSSAITGQQCVAPSPIKDPTMVETPRELTIPEIREIISQFGDCALRAKAAGFDAVEIHGAHGYLVGQFLSPFSNKRADEYGGDLPSRAKFALDIVRDIRQKCGQDYPILYRMSVAEYVHGGLDLEDAKIIAKLLESAGVDCIHCSQGVYASISAIIPPSCAPHALYVDNAAAIKSAVSIPVIAVGRINDPALAESIVSSGRADLCTMARASLADPELPSKTSAGRENEILHCIGCLQGCTGENGKGNYVRCLVNPMTGMEDEYQLMPAKEKKHIVIVGGGISGCETAIVAARRGHHVTILEQSDRLGGQWNEASCPVGKYDFLLFLKWQRYTLESLGVDIHLNCHADRTIIDAQQPDVVVLATGSVPVCPPIPGLDANSISIRDVFRNLKPCGKNVVVLGGGLSGAEVADHLAEHGHSVTIIEMRSELAPDGEASPVAALKHRLEEFHVHILTSARAKCVGSHQVIYEKDGMEYSINNIDTIINALGVRSQRSLLENLADVTYPVIPVGDCNHVSNGYLNIRAGYELGLTL